MNGLIWFKAATGTDTIAIRNALINSTNSELISDIHINVMVDKLAVISKNIKNKNIQDQMLIDNDDDDS